MANGVSGEYPSRRLQVQPDQPRPSTTVSGVSDETRVDERSTVVGSVAGLRVLRRTLGSWLRDLALEESNFVADVQLAIVEVVTNSFVHGTAESVKVTLRVEHRELVVTTEHAASEESPMFEASLPASTSVSGRGLYVVDQIARERLVTHAGGTNTTTLIIPVPADLVPDLQLVATGTDA